MNPRQITELSKILILFAVGYAVLRIWNPYLEEWVDQDIRPTDTSVSFPYGKYIDNGVYVKCGVILKNAYGSGGGSAKVYDTKNKKRLN